jgi:hypothetical protein
MYMGMDKGSGVIREGVTQHLDKWGPDLGGNMYYNYYATQVVFHYGDEPWKKWNKAMRDFLVNGQSKDGHEKGSWSFKGGDHGASAGGRLYCTAMAAMTLEVYYRYMPIYRKGADADFDKADGGAKPGPKKPAQKPPADKKPEKKADSKKDDAKKGDAKKDEGKKSDAKKGDSKKSDAKK